MKIKFLTAIIALCLAASPLSFAKESAQQKTKEAAAREKILSENVSAQDIEKIKTFNFEKVFAEVDKYFEAAKGWRSLKCIPQSGFICSKRECPKIKLDEPSCLILDRKAKTIALCHNKICRYYPATYEQTGVFINVKVEDSVGLYLRILGDSRFKEITMVGLDAYIANGNCEKIN